MTEQWFKSSIFLKKYFAQIKIFLGSRIFFFLKNTFVSRERLHTIHAGHRFLFKVSLPIWVEHPPWTGTGGEEVPTMIRCNSHGIKRQMVPSLLHSIQKGILSMYYRAKHCQEFKWEMSNALLCCRALEWMWIIDIFTAVLISSEFIFFSLPSLSIFSLHRLQSTSPLAMPYTK